MTTKKAAKFEQERDIVNRFLGHYCLSDPNYDRPECGIDVSFSCGSRKIGFQVTEFHNDEGATDQQRGSPLRNQEEKDAKSGEIRACWGLGDPYPSLRNRVSDKICKSKKYTFDGYDEIILLIAAAIPQIGGAGATFLLFLEVDKLNAEIAPILKDGRYSRAFIYHMMSEPPDIWEWSLQPGWRKLANTRGCFPSDD